MTPSGPPRRNHLFRCWQWIALVVVVFGSTRTSAQTFTSAFTYADVGNVGIAGSATASGGSGFDIHAAGADIWGTADSFGFVYAPLVGNGEVFVSVNSLQNTNPFAKVGVMLRDSLDPSGARCPIGSGCAGLLGSYLAQPRVLLNDEPQAEPASASNRIALTHL